MQQATGGPGVDRVMTRTGRGAIPATIAMAMVLAGGWFSPLVAAPPQIFMPDPNKATSSREAQLAAVQSIPMDRLDAQSRAKVSAVVSDVTIYRRMPTQVIQCDPELYLFLVRHPDVVVNIWEVLGVTQLKVRQTGPETFQVADGVGTQSMIQFLYRTHDTHLIYAEGRSDGPLFTKQVRGRGLLLLKTGYIREPDGRYYITNRLDTFLQLEPGGVELLTKTFQPLVGKVADSNFVQTAGFLGSLSKTAEANSRGVQRLAGRLEHVQPEVRQEFAAISLRIAQKAADLAAAKPGGQEPRVASRPQEEPKR
jgi:hypothetical protein